jgi:TonB family protein
MFDKLIESEPTSADFKDRRSYFVVSSCVVGIIFVAAVVISIYADDIGIGSAELELSTILPPVDMAAVEPDPARPRPPSPSNTTSQVAERQVDMARVDEPIAPTTTSVVRNTELARPQGYFQITGRDSDPVDSGTVRDTTGPTTIAPALVPSEPVTENDRVPEPPKIKQPTPTKTAGVVNGKATYLPIPQYPAAARVVGINGEVDIEVTIDEVGKVVSARAVKGPSLLRDAAERAAWQARFSPTLLSKVPVKVTGVIVYNFTR